MNLRKLKLYVSQGMKLEAGNLMQTIISTLESHLSPFHANNAMILDELAEYLEDIGMLEAALDYLTAANRLLEMLIGRGHYSRVAVGFADHLSCLGESLACVSAPPLWMIISLWLERLSKK